MASSRSIEEAYNSLRKGNLSSILPPGINNLTDTVAHAFTHFAHKLFNTSSLDDPPPEEATTALEHFLDFLYSRTALENTSLFLALTTFLVLAMSWTSRLGNLGRFSPFTRSPPQGSTKQQQSGDPTADLGPPRDTDIIRLRNKKHEYAVHFPAYSIAKGELTIGQVREQAAKKIGTADPRRIKLLYKGKNLKDDSRTCKQEGLREGAELMCTIAEKLESPSSSDDEDDEFGYDATTADGETKRRRNRGKKTKRRNKREEREGVSGTSTPQPGEPNLGVPNSQQHSRNQSPRPPTSPATPLDKLNELHQKLQTFIPDVRTFQTAPPSDPAKKEFEHKRLSETILTQVLLKLDAVETEGDADARTRRKALVQETQKVLADLDVAMKS